jgi:glycosyltransferase involved in cell wall biosynthesis
MLETLSINHGFLRGGRVVPNGRDAAEFQREEKRPGIFAAGRIWDEAKNLSALAAVAERLPWLIEIAGDAQDPNGRSIELKNVVSLGKLPNGELKQHLAECAIYALPARYEPFGLSALEAGLCGCALVLGDIPSLREVWGDAAVFVQPDDHEALVAALDHLIADQDMRTHYAERARQQAAQYSPTRMADGYRTAYRDCLNRHRTAIAA